MTDKPQYVQGCPHPIVEIEGTNPVMYVAHGSHANYFEAGNFHQLIVATDRTERGQSIGPDELRGELLPDPEEVTLEWAGSLLARGPGDG